LSGKKQWGKMNSKIKRLGLNLSPEQHRQLKEEFERSGEAVFQNFMRNRLLSSLKSDLQSTMHSIKSELIFLNSSQKKSTIFIEELTRLSLQNHHKSHFEMRKVLNVFRLFVIKYFCRENPELAKKFEAESAKMVEDLNKLFAENRKEIS